MNRPANRPWQKYVDEITSVLVEAGCTSIPVGCFFGHSKLRTISLPIGIDRIEDYTFA